MIIRNPLDLYFYPLNFSSEVLTEQFQNKDQRILCRRTCGLFSCRCSHSETINNAIISSLSLSLSCNAVNMFLQRRTTSGRNRLTVNCDAKLPLTSDSGTCLSLPPSLTKVIVRVLSEGIGGINCGNCGLIVKSPETRVSGSGRKAGETVVPRACCGFHRGDRVSIPGSGSASTRLAVVCWPPTYHTTGANMASMSQSYHDLSVGLTRNISSSNSIYSLPSTFFSC